MRSIGQRGELLVAERLIEQGWDVAHPLSDTSPFDLIAAKGGRFLRIQIKATLKPHSYPTSRPHYQFQLAKGLSAKKRYTKHEVDYFICCALDSRKFWVIPFESAGSKTLKIYRGNRSRFHQFENAWGLLGESRV